MKPARCCGKYKWLPSWEDPMSRWWRGSKHSHSMGNLEWNLAHPSKVSKYIVIPNLLSHLRPKEFMTTMMTPTNPCFLCKKILNELEDSCRNIQQQPSDPFKNSMFFVLIRLSCCKHRLAAASHCPNQQWSPPFAGRSQPGNIYLRGPFASFCLVPKPGESGVSLATCAHTYKIFSNKFSRLCFSCWIPDLTQHSSNRGWLSQLVYISEYPVHNFE